MSNSFAIAAATATLRNLLLKPVQARVSGLNDLSVTSQPPDLARKGNDKPAQINIFPYQTLVNAAWRNMDMPRQVRPGETAAPPLALNLHYLITAYGRGDNDNNDAASSYVLLGGAMSVLHDHPLLGRQEIRDALGSSDLADQFERIRITPISMSLEEMSKLWTVFQTQYRVSTAYEVTVVLIDSRTPVRSALPVLKRGQEDRGVTTVPGPAPNLHEIRLPRSQSAARLGEDIVILGEQFPVADAMVRFSSVRLAQPIELAPKGTGGAEITVHLPDEIVDPNALSRWAPGFYTVSIVVKKSGVPPIASNELAFALAPRVTVTPNNAAPGTVNLTLDCSPRIVTGQRVLLLFGDRQVEPQSINTPADPTQPTALAFSISGVGAGGYVVRLRVDGVDSIPVAYSGTPPAASFDPAQKVTVA